MSSVFDEGRSSCSVKFNMEMDDDKTTLDLKLTATTVGILAVKDSTHTIRCITQEIARKAKNNIDNRPMHNQLRQMSKSTQPCHNQFTHWRNRARKGKRHKSNDSRSPARSNKSNKKLNITDQLKRTATSEREVEQQKWETISADPLLPTEDIQVTANGEVEQQKWETISADPLLPTEDIPVTTKGEVKHQKWGSISTDPFLPTDSTPDTEVVQTIEEMALNNIEQVEASQTSELDVVPADATSVLTTENSDGRAVAFDDTEQVETSQTIELDVVPADATSALTAEGDERAVALNNIEQVGTLQTVELDVVPADATSALTTENSDERAVALNNIEQVGTSQTIELDVVPADATSALTTENSDERAVAFDDM